MNNNQHSNLTSKSWYLLFFIWIIATSGTLISLFFSDIMKLPVCVLCWYQRIALYPLVVIIPLGLFPFDQKIIRYIAALVCLGWGTALYHVLLIAGIIPEAAQPCVQGVPCSQVHLNFLGFLTIPMMSLLTFSVIGILLLLAHLQFPRKNHE
jgi:disulfide bond formation protein DsbB